jgi:hypothetical protein
LRCGVERGQRLVHQQQARAGRQRAGDRDALALAAGERVGPALQQVADAQQLDHLVEFDAARARARRSMRRRP